MREYLKKLIIGLSAITIGVIILILQINFIISIIAIVAGLIQIFTFYLKSKGNEKVIESYQSIIKDYQERNKELIEKHRLLEKKRVNLFFEKKELGEIIEKINFTLKEENISTEKIIEELDTSINALLFMKTSEDIGLERKIIVKNIDKLGFKHIDKGVYVLPPIKTPKLKNNNEIDVWIKKNVLKGCPKNYEYIVEFASIIDLKKTHSKRNVSKYRKMGRTIFEVLSIDDILPVKEALKYLKFKKNISLFDIIELTSFSFLVEEYNCSKKDYESLKKNNENILNNIKRELDVTELKTTDLATVDNLILYKSLDDYVSKPLDIAKMIKENASFWKYKINQEKNK